MQSAPEPWSLLAVLAFLSVSLGWILVVLAGALASIALICSAPIAARIGYGAMLARLEKEDPNNSLLQGSWEMIATARQNKIVLAYIDRYGFDANFLLTLGGFVMTLPGFYLGWHLALLVMSLFPTIYL